MVGKGVSSESASGFPSTMRIGGLNLDGKGGGPAFVGQVFSMCDLSGSGLMAVTTHFDIPIISKRTPEWMKKMFADINKGNKNGPLFCFFMDLGDADNILEESVDQHFHSLIQSGHLQRSWDVIDDNLTAEVVEDNGDSLWEPPEVQELLDEIGHPAIPFKCHIKRC